MDELTTTADGVWKMDVDAFVPKPEGYIKIKDVEYPIFGFLDVPIEESLKVTRLGDDIDDALTYDDRMKRSIEQIMMLNAPAADQGLPVLSREHFKSLRPKQLITLVVMATSIAKVPLVADRAEKKGPGDASSPSPSPASAASTDGGSGSSSA